MSVSALDFFRNTDVLTYKGREYANARVNVYPHKSELIFRSNYMDVSPKTVGDRTRHFELTADGYVRCKDTRYTLSDFLKARKRSRARSLDNVHGILRSNKWKYFATFTFDPDLVDRMNDDAVIKLFSRFRDSMRRRFSDFGMVAIPEYHDKGGLHFHACIAGADLESFLIPAINVKNGEDLYTNFGDRVYNLSLFPYGFSNVVCIKDQEYDRIANYITKYVTKDSTLLPNKKSYYASRNLFKRERLIRYYTPEQIENLLFGRLSRVNRYGEVFDENPAFTIRKSTDRYVIIDFPHVQGARKVDQLFEIPRYMQMEIPI